MYDDLRERDLDAVLVEEDLDLAVHDTGCLVDVLLMDASAEFEKNAAVSEFLNAEVSGFFYEKFRILGFESGDEFLDLGFNFFKIRAVRNTYDSGCKA